MKKNRSAGRGPDKRSVSANRPPSAAPAGIPLRLQSYLAKAGVASRRGGEDMIRAGRVTINGRIAEIGESVTPGVDRVELDGRPLEPAKVEWIALHKPRGYVTTRDDPRGRRTVYHFLPQELHHLFHVGRLDRESEGLLLLTNDGATANRLLHPRYGTTKEYVAEVQGKPDARALERLESGVRLDDGIARAESAILLDQVGDDTFRVQLVLREGRKREVRRMLEKVGHPVERLVRRRFGPVELGDLGNGRWRHLTTAEVKSLREGEISNPSS
ncbi:MAG TPA: pseudouridine synthase [Longimicrobiaceae bacterium]|nr:pseudouridine synthase [Longimicrobiaceae bacterium]